jgi:hypothetical protein
MANEKTFFLVSLRELGKITTNQRVSKLHNGNEDPVGAYSKYG